VTFTGLTDYRKPVLEERVAEDWVTVNQATVGNDFWQTDYSPESASWQITYNIKFDAAYQNLASLRDAPVTRTFRFRLEGAPTFDGWIAGTFAGGASIPVDKRGPLDDPDNDGISNLLEYALNGYDPTVGNPSTGTFNGTTLSYTKRPGTTGLTYAIQDSTDLGLTDPWAEVTGASYINNATTISFTPGTQPRYFLLLQVRSN
jgi:hypothetical protein